MGKFLRSHAACEANHAIANAQMQFPSRMDEAQLVYRRERRLCTQNGRNHFAQILFFSIFGHNFLCNFSKPTHF
jgi:hypothetical protein